MHLIQRFSPRRTIALAALAALGLAGFGAQPAAAKKKAPTMSWATYFNGTGWTVVNDVAVDPAGNVYIVGQTASDDLPVTPDALETENTTQYAYTGFVAKLSPDGSHLLWSTYFGGTEGGDSANTVALAPNGDVYVAGTALAGLPQRDSLQAYAGGGDAFVAKFSSAGSLLFSTYLGGPAWDYAEGIAADAQGNAYVAVSTYSADIATIPVVRPHTPLNPGDPSLDNDFYVAKIDTNAHAGVYATFLGGSSPDFAHDLALCHDGSVVVAGEAWSADYPTANALQPTGENAGVVTKLDGIGHIVFSTYLDGGPEIVEEGRTANKLDSVWGVALDAQDNVYVAGETASSHFPQVNARYAFAGGPTDTFVAKLTADGSQFVYSTFVGGSSFDRGRTIAVTPAGTAAIAVWTESMDYPIVNSASTDPDPVTDGTETTTDLGVTVFAPDGSVTYSGYVGGDNPEEPGAVALSPSGALYIVGTTQSRNFPTTAGTFQPAFPAHDVNPTPIVMKMSSIEGKKKHHHAA